MALSPTLDVETVRIDPAGDVILIVGSSNPTSRLLVSSKVLSLASPVFAVMFSPQFKEGSNLNPDRPCEVPLPEDEPQAMTLLCNCLHFRTDQIPRNVEFSLLKALAILCDKYDAARAISPWSIIWLQKWESAKCEDGFEGLLAVIYALDCAEAFTKMSKAAILDQVGSFDTNIMQDGFEMVPDSLIADLEVRRAAVQASLNKAIEDIATPLLGDKCHHRLFLSHAYFRALQTSALWPLSDVFRRTSLSEIMKRFSWLSEPNTIERRSCTCDICGKYYRPLLLAEKTKHLSSITGLCLDCVKSAGSRLPGEAKECRVAHDKAL